MKRILLLSILVLFGCSKDSENAASQTLIERLDGKFLGDSQPRIAVENSQTHPITFIPGWRDTNTTNECYRNFFYDNYSNIKEGAVINSLEILTNDINTFESELKYTNYCEFCTSDGTLDGIPAENTLKVELSLSETGRSYIFKRTVITEWPGSNREIYSFVDTNFYDLIDVPLTVTEACEFKRWGN